MPGPGGGGHGGGFHGGGGFSGGSRGGGFHGGPRGPRGPMGPRPPFFGGWFYPRGYYGGGCFSGLIGLIIAPVILIMFAAIILFATLGSGFSTLIKGGEIDPKNMAFQDYANAEYEKAFGDPDYPTYNDNILLIVLINEDYDDHWEIAWVGDNVRADINDLFWGGSALGYEISSITDNYTYSLSADLATVMEHMSKSVKKLGGDSPFRTEKSGTHEEPKLVNYTDLRMNKETVETALKSFTEETGIPVVIVVDMVDNVIPRTLTAESIFALIISLIFIIVAIVLIVNAIRRRNQEQQENN